MNQRIRKRLEDHVRLFGYQLTPEQEDEIIILYDLNNECYNDDTFSLHIENYMQRQAEDQDSKWMKQRRPSVFAKQVSLETFNLPFFEKSEKVTEFLMSRLGSKIPFCLISDEQKRALVSSMYPMEVQEGVVLIHEGDTGAEMYIVESGEFEVMVRGNQVNTVKPGEVIGELALLHGIPRTATVRATKASCVWGAEQTSFTCIRIRDQMYKKEIAKQVIMKGGILEEEIEEDGVEEFMNTLACKFLPADSYYELKDKEVVIILKQGRVDDGEEREVEIKDVVRRSFYCKTNIECYVIRVNGMKE